MKIIKRTIAVALIFSADGKILQGRKDVNKPGAYDDGSSWHIPGGGIEGSETIEEALIREVKEEVGIDIKNIKREFIDVALGESEKTLSTGEKILVKMEFHTYRILLPFRCSDVVIHLNSDLSTYRWTDPKELKNTKLTPPSVELFKKLGYLK